MYRIDSSMQCVKGDQQFANLMAEDDLADMYATEVASSMTEEANLRISEFANPEEEERLTSLSLVKLVAAGGGSDLIGAIMVRLGEVRAALIGHGGGVVVDQGQIVERTDGSSGVDLQLNLDGACVACGAAPGTLEAIQNDLLADSEVVRVTFTASMLESYDELIREFLEKHGNVTFV